MHFADKQQDACGVFGVYAPGEDAARLVYFGLHALQHRGQESAGIAVGDGASVFVYKEMGLVPQVFKEEDLESLQGDLAVGHVRYSTTGSTRWENAQPLHKSYRGGSFALAHNGNLINAIELREELRAKGSRFRSTSDTEVIAELVAMHADPDIETGMREAMKRLKGAYSIVLLSENKLFAMRDPWGIRPLALGRLGEHFVISSETCGLDIVGAGYVREVNPGELVVIDRDGFHSEQGVSAGKPSLCIFEFIYFARPDSRLYGKLIYDARKRMGAILADESGAADGEHADLVIGIPDTGTPAGVGYAEEAAVPYGEGLIKNRYIGRTFIQPAQSIRKLGIRLKLNPLEEVIRGKGLVVVDDSIVRGNTTRKLVTMLKQAGAQELHLRISSPPIRYPCFYGIDTANRAELIASTKSVEEVRQSLGADSLTYLSLEGLVEAVRCPRSNFCLACFNGEYPVPVPEELKVSKFALEEESVRT